MAKLDKPPRRFPRLSGVRWEVYLYTRAGDPAAVLYDGRSERIALWHYFRTILMSGYQLRLVRNGAEFDHRDW